MSRLIFEGDITERFGELFPKPFIEEIRVFDNLIETDVALYFEIEEGKDAVTFLKETGLSSLRIHLQFEPEARFTADLNSNRSLGKLLANYVTPPPPSVDGLVFGSGPPALADDGFADHAFFYNSEGRKFIKFYMTIQNDSLTETQSAAGSFYIYCITFFSLEQSVLTNPEQYKGQYSDIAYEKVYNSDGTLNVDRQEVYLETDGNYYSKMPLMSLDRNYRKTNLINSQQVASRIQSVIQPFVGSIEDADLISSTIQEHQNKSKFLIALQRRVNRFENKTATTVGGSLYGQLVDEISAINNILLGSDILQKRLQFNKIKDRRTERALVSNNSELTATSTEGLASRSSIDHLLFARPLVYRNLETNVPAKDFAFPEEAYIANKAYLFFDYEKALNYESRISQVFNPYNILELYGINSLNDLFAAKRVRCLISSTSGQRELTFYDNYYFRTDQEEFGSYEVKGRNIAGGAVYTTAYSYLYNGAEKYTFYENFVERAFDAGETLNGYRLRCYELDYLKQYGYINDFETLTLHVDINDKTLSFYENQIRFPFKILKTQLESYLSFAEEFCSYNNIDGRFNDFFLNAIGNEFSEPYPWDRAPLMYYSVLSLIYASWNFVGDTPTTRRVDGTPIDLDGIKDATLTKMKEISPAAGDLESLRDFVNKFSDLFNNFLDYDGLFNNDLSLYVRTNAPGTIPTISTPNVSRTLSSNPFTVSNILVDTDLSVVNPSTADQDFYKLTRLSLNRGVVTTIDFNELESRIETFNVLPDYVVTFKINEVRPNRTEEIRDERQKSFKQFYNENISSSPPGEDKSHEDPPNQLENLIFPLYVDFHQTLYDLIPLNLRQYNDGRTAANNNTDTDGTMPHEQWTAMWSTIEDTAELIEASMCDRRQFDKTGRIRQDDGEGHVTVTNRIFFNVIPGPLKEYFGTLIYNYYIYSYYIDRKGLSLKDFMNLILPASIKVS